MCGIAGYCNLESGNENLLKAMNAAQAHRGPDGDGYYVDGPVGLAQLRLAIIDREHGVQPLYNKDRSLVIVYNGEVYNYLELRKELEAEGYEFATQSDTEVVLQAYAAWGTAAFDRLNGMFALAIHDKKADKLVLARDHFGIKPLYMARPAKDQLLFASEIKPLLETGLIEKKPNERAIYRYLRFRIHEDSSETFFEGVTKLMPGEVLEITKDGEKLSSYTTLKANLKRLAEENRPYDAEATAEYKKRLFESVKARLQSEVPVGTSFSGGLDSSTVVAVINQLMQEDKASTKSVGTRQNTFSAIFPGSQNDEEKYVDSLLEKVGNTVTAHKIKPDADAFVKDLEDFIRTQEEPLISTGPYAQYKVMQEATNHVTVLLDGQGADETMAGYIPYYFVYLKQLKARGEWGKLIGELLSGSDIFLRFARVNLRERILRKTPVRVGQLINRDFSKKFADEKFTVTPDNLKLRLIEDTFSNSLPSLLRYEDKNTMRFSLEGRVPFLDKDVLKFLFALDDESIIKGGWNKRILRDATEGLLPPMINRRRNKIGFTTPEHEWFMRLKNRFYGIFLSEEFVNRPYWDAQAVAEAFEGFIKGKNDSNSLLFWRFLNVELWLREFFDEKAPEEPKREKGELEPNEGKQLDIKAGDGEYRRYPLRTDFVTAKDNLQEFVTARVSKFFDNLSADKAHADYKNHDWYFLISEKIVAITQGRSYFVWDITPGWWARFLSKRVTKTPYGIGLGSPWTMQLAIQEVGLPKILYASIGGAIGKLIGKRGTFYNLVGSDIRAIDGPTEYSVYPSNVSAKLAPKDPDLVAQQLTEAIRDAVPKTAAEHFKGVVVIDSNDIGRNVLGQNTGEPEKLFEDIFGDNPLGQADQRTPLCIVFKK
jgi:asparagine synthase (glutamine-hydrolysing)